MAGTKLLMVVVARCRSVAVPCHAMPSLLTPLMKRLSSGSEQQQTTPTAALAVFMPKPPPPPGLTASAERAKELGLLEPLEPRCELASLQKHRLLQAQHVRDQEAASDACNDETAEFRPPTSQSRSWRRPLPLLRCLCLLSVSLWSSATRQLTGRSVAVVAVLWEKT